MTIISKIVNKYTTNLVNVLCYSKGFEYFVHNTNPNIKIVEHTYANLNFHYDVYLVDMDYIETIPTIYKQFLSNVIVIDYNNIADWQSLKNLYDKYSQVYPTKLVTFDSEYYFQSNDMHDYLINETDLDRILLDNK